MANFNTKFHFHASKGWINDPNGFCYFNNKYHLFFQYDPDNTTPNRVCWGHAISDDLIKWEELDVALPIEYDYEKDGVWSGSAIVKNGILYLIYTGNKIIDGNKAHQSVCVATSTDGIHFKKYDNNPVIDLPNDFKDGTNVDFRDPYVYKDDESYCVLVGTNVNSSPRILLFRSNDLINYSYKGIFYQNDNLGTMFECPSYLDGKGLIISPQNLASNNDDYWNISSSIFVRGNVNNNKLIGEHIQEIDHGLEFYAPQTKIINGKEIMTAWFNMWGRRYYLHDIHNDYEGFMTLPRELLLVNKKLYQKPISSIYRYLSKDEIITINSHPLEINNETRLVMKLSRDNSLKIGQLDDYFEVLFDFDKKEITFDRSHAKNGLGGIEKTPSSRGVRKLQFATNEISLEIFIDNCTIEFFINGGEQTSSNLMYFQESINLYSSNEINNVIYNKIIIN